MTTKFEMKPQKGAAWKWVEHNKDAEIEAEAVMRVTVPYEGKWQPCKLHLMMEDIVNLVKLPQVQEFLHRAEMDGEE